MQINSNLNLLLAASLGKPSRNLRFSNFSSSPTTETENSSAKGITESDSRVGQTQSAGSSAQLSTGRELANAVSFGQTQGAYLRKVAKALNRMSDLAIQAQDDTQTDSQRQMYQQEFTKLGNYIKSIAGKDFNGIRLFSTAPSGSTAAAVSGGPSMPPVDLNGKVYSEAASSSLADATSAKQALTSVKAALAQVSTDQMGVATRVDVLSSVAEDISGGPPEPATAGSNEQEVANGWVNSVSMYQMLFEPGMALMTQANLNPGAVSRLLHPVEAS